METRHHYGGNNITTGTHTKAYQTMVTVEFCSSPLTTAHDSDMDGKQQNQNQNISYGRATAAVASGLTQWDIEEGETISLSCYF